MASQFRSVILIILVGKYISRLFSTSFNRDELTTVCPSPFLQWENIREIGNYTLFAP